MERFSVQTQAMHLLKKIFYAATLFLPVFAVAEIAGGATDGAIGTTSTATLEISLTVPPLFRVSGIDGIYFGIYKPNSGDLVGDDDICVWTNQSTADYTVNITDDSNLTPGSFAVENETHTEEIPIEIRWNSTAGTTGNLEVAYGLSFQATGANTQSPDCSTGGFSANIQTKLREENLMAASAGLYSNQLLVVIGP